MPLSFTLKAERTTKEDHDRGNFGTGTIELVLDGTVIARFNKFALRWSQQQQKYYIKPPARSVDEVNPQTGQPVKRWFDQWEYFPGDRQVHDGWTGAFLTEIFKQIPDIVQVCKESPNTPAAGYAPPASGQYGAPAGGPPMPGPSAQAPQQPQQPQQYAQAPQVAQAPAGPPPLAAQPAPAPIPGGYGGPPAPPAGPSGGGWGGHSAPGAPPVPQAPGASPKPSPGAPAFAPQGRPSGPPPGPSQNMPTAPHFPLPG